MAAPKEKDGGIEANKTPGAPPVAAPRRDALRTLAVLGTIAYAGALAIPAALFVVTPKDEAAADRQRWVRLVRLADLPEGKPHRAEAVGDERDAFTITRGEALGAVWLVKSGDRVSALSATCPHLGCAIDLAPGDLGFACPCHASRFAVSGEPESGPSPRAMDSLATRVVDGWVEVDYRRYRQGVSAREEVSA